MLDANEDGLYKNSRYASMTTIQQAHSIQHNCETSIRVNGKNIFEYMLLSPPVSVFSLYIYSQTLKKKKKQNAVHPFRASIVLIPVWFSSTPYWKISEQH